MFEASIREIVDAITSSNSEYGCKFHHPKGFDYLEMKRYPSLFEDLTTIFTKKGYECEKDKGWLLVKTPLQRIKIERYVPDFAE